MPRGGSRPGAGRKKASEFPRKKTAARKSTALNSSISTSATTRPIKQRGRPKGSLSRSTMDKLAAREYLRERVTAELDPLLDAQIQNAKGLKYLITRDKKTGKFIRVTETMAKAKSGEDNENEETIEVWEKDPSVQAFTDLLNRAFDKPKEQEQELNLKGALRLIHEVPA